MLVCGVFFVLFTKMFVIFVIYVYFTYILQGTVETHLRCGEICNNLVIATIVLGVCQ